MNCIFLLSSFEEFFPLECNVRQHYNTHQDFYYCNNCFFNSINYAGSGGVFYYYNAFIKFLCEKTTFSTITASGHGGCIYFNCPNGQYVCNKICTLNTKTVTGHSGQFSYLIGQIHLKSHVFYTSLIQTGFLTNTHHSTITMQNGSQLIENTNFSKNLVNHYIIYSYIASNLKMTFFTLDSNQGANFLIYYQATLGTPLISHLNFVNNSVPSANGLIQSYNIFHTFQNSFFLNNTGFLFTGYLTASNCYISHIYNITSGVNAIVVPNLNCVNDLSCMINTHYIDFYSTYLCQIPTPPPTTNPTLNPQDLTPCITLPPSPTSCIIESQNILTLFDVNNIINSFFFTLFLI